MNSKNFYSRTALAIALVLGTASFAKAENAVFAPVVKFTEKSVYDDETIIMLVTGWYAFSENKGVTPLYCMEGVGTDNMSCTLFVCMSDKECGVVVSSNVTPDPKRLRKTK